MGSVCAGVRAQFFFQSFLYTYSKVSNKSFGCLFEIFMACNASVNSRCTNAPLGQMIKRLKSPQCVQK